MFSCEAVTEKALDTDVLHMLSEIHHDRENWVPQCVACLILKGAVPEVAIALIYAHGAFGPNNLSVRKEVCEGPYVGHSHPHTLSVQCWTPGALALEVCRS